MWETEEFTPACLLYSVANRRLHSSNDSNCHLIQLLYVGNRFLVLHDK